MERAKLYRNFIVPVLFLAIILLLGILYKIQITQNEKQVQHTSTILLEQIVDVIDSNLSREALLVDSLKEDYATRAKAISYILDRSPEFENDIAELLKIAGLAKVDEIHIFDETGTIYAGTQPQYYGYSFDSGKQMAYFKPMLHNKKLEMIQDIMPNTAENKMMMYAICWNEKGTRMLQVGISPKRLIEEVRVNSLRETVEAMPAYTGVTILVADKNTGEILGATYRSMIGQNLDKMGIIYHEDLTDRGKIYNGKSSDGKFYYAVQEHGKYLISVSHMKNVVHRDVPPILGLVTIYLLSVTGVFILIIKRLAIYADNEAQKATTDIMTGFYNFRGYEDSIQGYKGKSLHEHFVYSSMDLNGLKQVNDTLGHEAGNKLIQIAACCIKEAFGRYGKLYRVGGDEFVALLIADEKQLQQCRDDFENRINNRQGELTSNLSVSCGFASRAEFPDKTVPELAKIADARMYDTKKAYYLANGMGRAHRRSL